MWFDYVSVSTCERREGRDSVSRSYNQLCGLALALDVIGDRWSLLIVRELLVRPEGVRYTDLRDGLPGVATNLLADRLRDLQESGVVRRDEPRPPVATPVFRLTEYGRALRPAVEALAVWGGERVPAASDEQDFRSRWLVVPIEGLLADHRPGDPAVRVEVRTGDEPVVVEVSGGEIRARAGTPQDRQDDRPDLVISGPPKPVLGVISGKLPIAVAAGFGVVVSGDATVVTRLGLD
jgi:DNA-binding HxlR family transcriptional regulator